MRIILFFTLAFFIFAGCSKTQPKNQPKGFAQQECIISKPVFTQAEKESARKSLETKGIPATTDSLNIAINSRDKASVEELLKVGINPNDVSNGGRTPLMSALDNNSSEIISLLVKSGAQVNAPDQNGWIPFVQTVARGDMASVILMLEYCANVNIKEPQQFGSKPVGNTPLQAAINKRDSTLVQLLIGKGADVNVKAGPANISPLYNASSLTSIEIVRLLVEKGADIKENRGGWTPLIAAMNFSRFDIAKFLIENGADINAITPEGLSAIRLAKKHNRQDIIDLLIAKGVRGPE